MRKHAWLITNFALLLATVGLGFFVVTYRQDIQDWWALRSYQVPADVKQLADETGMHGFGRDIFYVSQPVVEDSTAFNMHCERTGEKTVLGCYVKQRIYIFNITDPRVYGVKQSTAAHEMLHAAYERLDESEKQKVNAMIEAELPLITDERLKTLIKSYEESEPGIRLNELHSILGTEQSRLSPELEIYYAQYFSDRSKVVTLANAYLGTFEVSRAKIAQLQGQLAALKIQIEANSTVLTTEKAAIDAEVARLNALRTSDVAAYNQAVPPYNARAKAYNQLVIATRALIDQYNALVVEHNSEAAAQNSIYNSLDSHHQTVN